MSKGLFTYTTSIPVEKTMMELEQVLAKAGATAIMKEYRGDGTVKGLAFKIQVEKGAMEVPFKLPMNVDAVLQVLGNQKRRNSRVKANSEQAYRVGWRIMLYWVKAQCAIIETNMVTVEQVFLPYIQVDPQGNTLFDRYLTDRNKLLQLPEVE